MRQLFCRKSILFYIHPLGPGELAPIVGRVIMWVFQRRVDLFAGERRVLGIDPHFVGVPYDYLVPGIAEEVEHFHTLGGMAVLGEDDDLAAPSVDHAALFAVRVQEDQILAVAGPVDGDDDVAVGAGFVAVEQVSVTVIEQDDALAPPEGGDGNLPRR